MTDPRGRTDSPGARRSRRSTTALVAQYIHELSVRHGETRQSSRARAGRPKPRSGVDPVPEPQPS